MITMLTGGSRSGKSTFALNIAERFEKKAFVATAESFDSEMEDRIQKHQDERGNSYQTFEEPINLANAIKKASEANDVIIIDCLTVWIGNLMHYHEDLYPNYPQIKEFYSALKEADKEIVIVTNELGMGLIPPTSMGRKYRDLAGRVNQDVASIANNVTLVVSGLPVYLKGVNRD